MVRLRGLGYSLGAIQPNPSMKIRSSAFADGAHIPARFSRFGDDRSPPLEFSEIPSDSRSLALIVDDPDAPTGTFTHWLVFNLSPSTPGLKENGRVDGMREGSNDWDETSYGGPRPPRGVHRYYFRLYALDTQLDLPAGASRADVEHAMSGHVLAEAQTMGRFATPVQAGLHVINLR